MSSHEHKHHHHHHHHQHKNPNDIFHGHIHIRNRLEYPIENELRERKGNRNFRVGASCFQGFRLEMEDEHDISVCLSESQFPDTGFFAVFDGHMTGKASATCSKQFRALIEEEINKSSRTIQPQQEKKEENTADTLSNTEQQSSNDNNNNTTKKGLDVLDPSFLSGVVLRLDKEVLTNTRAGGSTAIFALISRQQNGEYEYTVGNVGDSRAILIQKRDGASFNLSKDHKPDIPSEKERIENADGFVKDHRVDGSLAMSRAIGDKEFKSSKLPPHLQKVSPVPDFVRGKAQEGDTIVLYCDGIVEGDDFGNAEVAAFLYPLLYPKEENQEQEAPDLTLVASKLMHHCLTLSNDNMSVVIIQLTDGSSFNREEVEFVPGPIHSQSNEFLDPYAENCKQFGSSLEQAQQLLAQRLKNNSSKANQLEAEQHQQQMQQRQQATTPIVLPNE